MESTSNSFKFTPMPMSALLAELMPIKKPEESPVVKYSSEEESDNSLITTQKKPLVEKQNKVELITFTPVISQTKKNAFMSVQKSSVYDNKENINNHSLSSNWKCPNKEIFEYKVSNNEPQLPSAPSILASLEPIVNSQNSNVPKKKTPDIARNRNNSQKTKTATPNIKSGIRKFTPGSGHHSNRKSTKKVPVQKIKESVRCLFPDEKPKDEVHCPAPSAQQIPETPLQNKPLPASYVATPSYPQGVVKNHSKILFKTTIIKGKNYMYVKKLGTGGSSEVYKVLEVGTSCEYAVKCVNLGTDPEQAKGYVNEVRLLRDLQKSDRVIRLYDYEYDRENKFLRVVMEVGETDLSSFLKARGAGLPPALVLHYWEEMLHAVRYIHEHGVIHADLKPGNFLLVCGRLKLIDFGIASSIASDATSVVRTQATGTYSYISPEALMGGAGGYGVSAGEGNAPIKISFRSDVWSLGCILYSMVYGRTPFGLLSNMAKLAAILDPNHRIDYPPVEHLPPSLIDALKWCLTYNARARPSVSELLALKHLDGPSRPLPQPLLARLQHHVTAEEWALLTRARV